MGQSKPRTTEFQLNIEPAQTNYRMAKAIAPRKGQSWLDASKETDAGVGVDHTPENRYYSAKERDATAGEAISSTIGGLFKNIK